MNDLAVRFDKLVKTKNPNLPQVNPVKRVTNMFGRYICLVMASHEQVCNVFSMFSEGLACLEQSDPVCVAVWVIEEDMNNMYQLRIFK